MSILILPDRIHGAAMPIPLRCPACSVKLTLADDRAGTRMDCPKCERLLLVPHCDTDAEPARDVEPDDAPIRSNRSRRRRRNRMLIATVVGCIAIVPLLTCAGVGGWFYFLRDNPEKACNDMMDAVRDGKYDRAWDRLDSKSQSELTLAVTNAKALPILNQDILRMLGGSADGKTGKDLFAGLVAAMQYEQVTGERNLTKTRPGAKPLPARIVSIESYTVTGEIGAVKVRRADGKVDSIDCIRENGKWRVRLFSKTTVE